MLCDGMVHHIRRVRVRVRVRAEIRVKSRPTCLPFSRSSGYACTSPMNSLVTLFYGIGVQIRVRARVRVRVMVRVSSPLGPVLRVHRGLGVHSGLC